MAGLSGGERLVNILIGYSDPFTDDLIDPYIDLTDVPECDALSVALGAAKVHGHTQYFDIVIRRTTDETKFNSGFWDEQYAKNEHFHSGRTQGGYRFTHTDFDLETKED